MAVSNDPRASIPWWVPLAAAVAAPLLKALLASYRTERVFGGEHFDRLRETREPVVFACWHNRQMIGGGALLRRLVKRGYPLYGLVSRSRDGEILARTVRRTGIRIVRGSTSRGGLASVLKLLRVLRREQGAVAAAPDGPRGPVYKAQAGLVVLARMSGVPIVPIAAGHANAWRLGSWDRLFVPKPFSRVSLAIGEPYRVSSDEADDAAETQRLEDKLNALVARAESVFDSRE